MAENSKIEWTDATFNPWIGCAKVSAGCKLCYAETLMDHRYGKVKWGIDGTRVRTSTNYWNQPLLWNKKAQEQGKPIRVFCASLADVFESRIELDDWRIALWALIEKTPFLIWMLLTKRPENIWQQIPERWIGKFPHNIWLGFSAEDQDNYNQRAYAMAKVDQLLNPACVWISAEPLLGSITINPYQYRTDWVIVGGESGDGCRAMDISWARSLHGQCLDYMIPFFMKQLGGYPDKRHLLEQFPDDLSVREFPME